MMLWEGSIALVYLKFQYYFLRCPAIYLLLPPHPPRKKRPVSFQAPQHRLTSGDSAHDQWHGGYTHLKCETFSMLEELPWQTVSVRLSDKLQGQKQRHIRFRDLIWTITLWNTKQWMFGANWTTRTANPVISREMYPCRAVPSPAAPPPPSRLVTVLNKDQLQLCNMLAKISETLEPIYSIWKLVSAFIAAELSPNQTQFPKGGLCSFTVRIFSFLKCTHLKDLKW